ncbi:hypothetical protein N0M98_15325 [Paenibacillus doosanensis]|uniref:Uncharacterized protein n=1 Tax=Paenibacillus konkukensis TaxID=2020716 RepID=A0ABY4RHA0_9BACL|nr:MULTISPECIES: hypothetical protein [Paenibacillus]MCS7461522.1 hypothetical protein [Paenibacillus doosanensis]UQZ80989.1 hypothetical protein SK3146_00145 [Paenibacillus konkukensis]
MKWEDKLSQWMGSQIEVHIEDQAGLDPVAPPKKITLEKIKMTDNNEYMQIYMNEHQFLAIPILGEDSTSLVTTDDGAVLCSSDAAAQLVYKVYFGV